MEKTRSVNLRIDDSAAEDKRGKRDLWAIAVIASEDDDLMTTMIMMMAVQ